MSGTDEAAALPGARLARDRRETRQAGDRLGVEAAEFRHLGEQACRGDARHARRGQDLGPAGQYHVFGQPLAAGAQSTPAPAISKAS